MTGWILLAALYFIGFICTLAINIASYGDRDNPLIWRWRWRWALLAWPWLWMSDAWNGMDRVMAALRRKWP